MATLIEMASLALIPLVWSTPVEFGGLDMSPASIGLCMSAFGCVDGLFQFAVFPHLVRRFGLRRVFVTCVSACAVVIVMFPLENLVMRHAVRVGGSTVTVWPLIFMQLLSFSALRMGFSTSFFDYPAHHHRGLNAECGIVAPILLAASILYVALSIPNHSRRSLGAVHGLARVVACVQNAIGPAVADSLFAFSVTNNVLGGNFVYVVLLTLVCACLYLASKLPRHMWTHCQ
jgi:MFS family permease